MDLAVAMAEAAGRCHRGRYDEAIALLEELRERFPGEAELHNQLGVALTARGRHQEAERAFREAVRLRPDHAAAWANLGSNLSLQGYRQAPLQALSKALQLAPRNLELVRRTGSRLLDLGHLALSRRCCELVLRHRPDDVEAATGLANVLERQGDVDAAHAQLAPFIEAGRLSPNAAATWSRIHLRRRTPEQALGPIDALLGGGMTPTERGHLLYSRGSLLDRLGRYGEAFSAYEQANALQGVDYDPEAHEAEVDAIIETFSAELFEALPPERTGGDRTVLIVGMPRSGTSLVEQVLASHPAVHGAGEREELHLLSLAVPRKLCGTWPSAVTQLGERLAGTFGLWYEGRLGAEAGDALRVTDKMPANLFYLGLAAVLLPRARVVYCLRDPLDTCLSCFFQQFHHAHAWSTRLGWLGHRYREHERLARHWGRVLPLPMTTVRYEDMVDAPEATSRTLVDFAGLAWDPACLRFHDNRRFVGTASYSQVQQPIYKRSVGRAESYEAWLGPLRAELQAS